jgi:very-short-patch-repair endonuclease
LVRCGQVLGMRIDERHWRTLLDSQDGVAHRLQLWESGWTSGAVEHRLGREWQVLLPGVVLTSTGVPTVTQRRWAAVLWGGPEAALTSWTGLAVHGVRCHETADVHVAVPHRRQLSSRPFGVGVGVGGGGREHGGRAVVHRTTRPLESVGTLPRLPVARCVVDAALGLGSLNEARAVVSAAVQQRRTTVALLTAELAAAPQRGSGLLRQALDEVGEGARSAPEAALARALRRQRLPSYRLDVDLYDRDGRWLARVDLAFLTLRLVVEVDGERWHLSADRWVADVARHTRLEAQGWTVLRYPASRVLADPDGVAAEIAAVAARIARAS